jgi:hypothetical protein
MNCRRGNEAGQGVPDILHELALKKPAILPLEGYFMMVQDNGRLHAIKIGVQVRKSNRPIRKSPAGRDFFIATMAMQSM